VPARSSDNEENLSVDSEAVLLFLSLLALGAQLAVVVLLVTAIGGRVTAGARWWIIDNIGPHATLLAFVVAAVATAGSLYLSEGANFTPCTLCWYQRIAMYPLVVVLGIATWRRDDIAPYAYTLAGIGGSISIYHMLVERFPSLETSSCDPTNPCSLIWTERFGYQTIPTMALSAFALIIALTLTGRAWLRSAESE
jgi:disulfide bond formation protein DsbB